MKINFFALLLIYSIKSISSIQDDCPICQFDEYFNPSNGYGCIQLIDNQTRCTCPDQLSTINQPCRICNRTGICGPQTATCSEQSTTFSPTNNGSHFACFCSSGSLLIGEKCPEEIITITHPVEENTPTGIINATTTIIDTKTISTGTTNPVTITSTTSTIENTTMTAETVTKCKGQSISSHLYMEPILIILLNFVYFVNK